MITVPLTGPCVQQVGHASVREQDIIKFMIKPDSTLYH